MASSSKQNVTSGTQKNNDKEVNNDNTVQEEFLPGFKNLQEYTQTGFRALLEMTKTSNSLPDEESWAYFSSFPSFQDAMTSQGTQVIKLLSNVLKSQGVRGNMARRDMEEKFDLLLDANDTLLERVALNLDEVAGIRKNPEIAEEDSRRIIKPLSGSWNQTLATASPSAQKNASVAAVSHHVKLLATKVITRPQLNFPDKIDNTMQPFEPRIKHKPNAKKPLSVLLELTENGEGFSHPYGYELDMFEPTAEQMKEVTLKPPRAMADTPLKYVDCADSLKNMVNDLRNYNELAVDLEHHSYRSFQGFTCLMQISTRHTDYVIDTLILRGSLHILNEIFTKTSVVKVLHGSDSDVEWLQRDLSLYLVNVFDTHQAGKLLNIPRLSLAFIVKYYCDVDLDKTFQLADWRLRPLLPEMIEYARGDTHYLLYVYDRMKNALVEAGLGTDRLIKSAINQSTQICKKIYIKPQYNEESHLKLYQKSKKMFNNRQMYAMKEIFMWRDLISRSEDESIGYVLPNHMLLQIAEALPREMQGILACCNPIPPLVRQNLGHLHGIILRAREQPLIQVATVEETMLRAPQTEWTKVNIESVLHCPHQLPAKEDQRDDLPTLLGPSPVKINPVGNSNLLSPSPCITLLGASNNVTCEMGKKVLSPYQRYMLVKPYMLHLAKQAAMQEAKDQKPAVTTEVTSDQQRMERIKLHFLALDSRSAANEAPPTRPDSPKEEEEVKEEPKSESDDEVQEVQPDYEPPAKHPRLSNESEKPLPMRFTSKQLKKQKWKKKLEAAQNRRDQEQNNTQSQQSSQSNPQSQQNFQNGVQQKNQNMQQQNKRKKPYKDRKDRNKQRKKIYLDNESGARVVMTQHDAEQNDMHPEEMSSMSEEPPEAGFDYSTVDFSRFQGGSKQFQHKQKRGGGNDRGRGRGRGKKFNFPQRQNQKSFTYKNKK